jgi:hypothetical protein
VPHTWLECGATPYTARCLEHRCRCAPARRLVRGSLADILRRSKAVRRDKAVGVRRRRLTSGGSVNQGVCGSYLLTRPATMPDSPSLDVLARPH